MKVYIQSEKTGVNAMGHYNSATKELVVLKGSCVSTDVCQSEKFRSARSVIKMRNEFVKNGVVVVDVPFKSPSSAGNFVTGRSTNGYIAWKDENGVLLRDLIEKDKE